MKSLIFLSQALRQLAFATILISPLMYVSASGAELVGKPASVNAAQTSSTMTVSATAVMAEESSAVQEDQRNAKDLKEVMDKVGPALNDAFEHHGDEIKTALLIPLFAISFGVGGPIFLVIFLVMMHYRAKRRRQENINANIDKLLAAGRDIPVELLLGDEDRYVKTETQGDKKMIVRDDAMMQKGVRNIGLGVGLLIFLTFLCGINIGAVGFIFIALGVSRLVIWKLSANNVNAIKAQD